MDPRAYGQFNTYLPGGQFNGATTEHAASVTATPLLFMQPVQRCHCITTTGYPVSSI